MEQDCSDLATPPSGTGSLVPWRAWREFLDFLQTSDSQAQIVYFDPGPGFQRVRMEDMGDVQEAG